MVPLLNAGALVPLFCVLKNIMMVSIILTISLLEMQLTYNHRWFSRSRNDGFKMRNLAQRPSNTACPKRWFSSDLGVAIKQLVKKLLTLHKVLRYQLQQRFVALEEFECDGNENQAEWDIQPLKMRHFNSDKWYFSFGQIYHGSFHLVMGEKFPPDALWVLNNAAIGHHAMLS